MLAYLSKKGKKTAVVAVDPSSPFHLGALLGDRIRMNTHANDPNIYIRSLASRGNLGGLSAKSLEVTELLRAAPFDMIIVETVGVGQSEIEIAGLADITILVTTPGAGDDVQLIKAGIMEIADIFIVNKSDTDPESEFYHKLVRNIKEPNAKKSPPVIRTSANTGAGIDELIQTIETFPAHTNTDKKATLLTIKTLQLIREIRTRNVDPGRIKDQIFRQLESGTFNLYRFANDWEGGNAE
jgi:LAO/AO transport system kinase